MRQSMLRLRSVRWKNGGEIRLLPAPTDRRVLIQEKIRDLLSRHDTPVTGFAFVAWSSDGGSSAIYAAGEPLLTMQIPDFVRERLMAEAVLKWAREER